MTERPILFSAPMVRAILAGTKTQTRRAIKCAPHYIIEQRNDGAPWPWMYDGDRDADHWLPCPYGHTGDTLWVRETWMDLQGTGIEHRNRDGKLQRYAYRADSPPGSYSDEARKDYGLKWRPSIHMPRAASRITLEITGVRVERLQDISEADALAEGCALECMTPTGDDSGSAIHGPGGYIALWESINGQGSWEANPWVWAIDFRAAPKDAG